MAAYIYAELQAPWSAAMVGAVALISLRMTRSLVTPISVVHIGTMTRRKLKKPPSCWARRPSSWTY